MWRKLFIVLIVFLLPCAAHAACSNPVGAEGDVIYNTSNNVPQYCDGSDNWIAMVGAEPYISNAVKFDGSTYLEATAATVGLVDGDKGTVSVWVKFDPNDFTSSHRIFWATGGVISLHTNTGSGGEITLYGENPSSSDVINLRTNNFNSETSGWHHIIASWDLTNDIYHLYIDDTSDVVENVWTSGETLDYDNGNIFIGADTGGGSALEGAIADLWFEQNSYIDLSIEANRRKFIDAAGNPVFLGTNGSRPTGSAPDIFLSGDTATWHTNKGTGGGFTENGALTTASTYPGGGTQIVPNGLIGHWRLDETSGTFVDSTGNGHDGTQSGGVGYANSGVINNAAGFDGLDDVIDVSGDGSYFDLTGGDSSFSVWFRADPDQSETWPRFIDRYTGASGGSGYRFGLEDDGDDVEFIFEDNASDRVRLNGATPFNDGKWHHAVAVLDGGNATLYVDNAIEATDTYGTLLDKASATGFRIGDNAGGTGSFNGSLDDLRIYNRALTPAEVAEIYNARDGIRYNKTERVPEFFDGNRYVAMPHPFPDVTDGLVGHWKLDEISGTTAIDSSVNGNNGTMTNGMDAATDTTSGAVGAAISFDGVDDSVDIAANAAINDTFSGGGTISAWVYRDAATTYAQRIANKLYEFYVGTTGTLEFGHPMTTTGGYWATTATLPFNEWVHVAATHDPSSAANDVTIYINGQAQTVNEIQTPVGTYASDSANSLLIGNNQGNIRTFRGGIDDFRLYDRLLTSAEIAKLYAMGAPVGSSTALPQGCPNIGDVCDDGTIYAGLSPDGNVAMFTTKEDAGALEWNDGASNYTTTSATNSNTGSANTSAVVVADSNSVTGGFQIHNAAQHCYDLATGGADDWYLPAQNELSVLYTNRLAIGNFELTNGEYGALPSNVPSWYWSSTENGSSDVVLQRFEDGTTAGWNKFYDKSVRCVRKGPAPRCANPYGIEGAMIYNTNGDVVQYCDGARWIAIGKDQ